MDGQIYARFNDVELGTCACRVTFCLGQRKTGRMKIAATGEKKRPESFAEVVVG